MSSQLNSQRLGSVSLEFHDEIQVNEANFVGLRSPVTRYYGSKRKVLPLLWEVFRPLKFGSALDAFGGTASVSHLLRHMGKDVTFNDAFKFNADVARTILSNAIALPRQQIVDLIDNVKPKHGLISEYFHEVFFTKSENHWLDGFMLQVSKGNFDKKERSLLLYLLYQACLKKRPFNLFHRLNLRLRTNENVKRSFGNAATWERSFSVHMLTAFDELASKCVLQNTETTILPPTNASDLKPGYDLVYLDPPYVSSTGKSRHDNYWRKYHFLEGLADYDNWEERICQTSPIRISETPPSFEEWANPKTFKAQLEKLILKHHRSIVVLSYVRGTIPTENELLSLFERLFSDVRLHSFSHNHALSKANKRELILVGQP